MTIHSVPTTFMFSCNIVSVCVSYHNYCTVPSDNVFTVADPFVIKNFHIFLFLVFFFLKNSRSFELLKGHVVSVIRDSLIFHY